MKRRSFKDQTSTALQPYGLGEIYDTQVSYEDEPEILDPIKFSDEEKASRIVTILGFKFFDTGYALACLECGKISGLSCREDLDKKIDFFLKFGCEHYTNTGEALETSSEVS